MDRQKRRLQTLKLNRNYKDAIFRYIFKQKDEFAKLYQDLAGDCIEPQNLKRYDLDSLIQKDWRNDISFLTEDKRKIILVEAQSTVCNNMAVRCMIYYVELIKHMFDKDNDLLKKLYSPEKMKLPAPEFYVAYSGKARMPLETDVLSAHFDKIAEAMKLEEELKIGIKEKLKVELEVEFKDINYKNLDLEKTKSHSLIGYSYFLEQCRYFAAEQRMNPEEAVRSALQDCRKQGYLLEYLDREEFQFMAYGCITMEDIIKVREDYMKEQGRAEGRAEGEAKGKAKGEAKILDAMKRNGLSDKEISKITGYSEKEIENILKAVEDRSLKTVTQKINTRKRRDVER